MNNNENINTNINNKISRKKLIKIVIISVVAFATILVFYKIISYYTSQRLNCKQLVLEYLQEKYNEEFNIKFVGKRSAVIYERKELEYNSGCYQFTGIDDNIKEYVFAFWPRDNNDIICYVAYAHYVKENVYEIYEISKAGMECLSHRMDDVYEGKVKEYNKEKHKFEIEDTLKNYLGEGYTIDLRLAENSDYIEIKTHKSFRGVVLEDLEGFANTFNNIVNLLQDKDIYISIEYVDKEISIKKDSKIEDYERDINQILNGTSFSVPVFKIE